MALENGSGLAVSQSVASKLSQRQLTFGLAISFCNTSFSAPLQPPPNRRARSSSAQRMLGKKRMTGGTVSGQAEQR